MKILMLKPYYFPEIVSSTHLSNDMMQAYMNEEDITVDIFAPYPSRGVSAEVRRDYIENHKVDFLNEGRVIVRRFPMFKEGKNSLLRAFRYFLCIVRNTVNGLKDKEADVLVIGSTPPINGLMMSVLKRHTKLKIVYDLQDIFPDSLVNAGMTKKGSLLWKIGRAVENITYKACDKIIVISEDFKKNIIEKGVPEEKIEVIYNWVDEKNVVKVERNENPLFDKYNLDRDKFYVCYSGNVGYTQNLEMLKKTAKELEEYEDIGFVIVGEGAYKEKFQKETEEEGVKNITFIPFQDYSEISNVFSIGDVGLIISKKGIGSNSVPSKTWSIMSASKPVLASFDKGSELDRIITGTKCGICVEADDANAFKDAVLDMYNNKDLLNVMGEKGRQYVLNNLTKEIGTSRKMKVIRDVVND